MKDRGLAAAAERLKQAALEAVDPEQAVRRHVRREGAELLVGERRYLLDDYGRVFLIGGGKAAVAMARAAVQLLGDRLERGVVVTKYGHSGGWSSSRVEVIEAGHPVPDANSVRGADAVVEVAAEAGERDLVICLISGGGSALLSRPVEGITLAALQMLTEDLLRSGATIDELNTVRKHYSGIKGGHLARLAFPADVVTLILSDVVGDRLDVIASGPTVPDATTTADARAVLDRHGILLPAPFQETPKRGDPAFDQVLNVVVGSNREAALAAVDAAWSLGYKSLLMGTYVEGEAREVGRVAAGVAKGIQADGDPISPPACVVWGGETTVTVRGQGKGGRNQELALAAAMSIAGWEEIRLMALATDGTDGPTDAAGAVVSGDTIPRARSLGVDPREALEANDSYSFFDEVGGLLRTGPTGTNVNDLLFVLVGRVWGE